MYLVLIVAVALLTYPVIAWLFIRLTKNYLRLRRISVLALLGASCMVILCAFTKISTISEIFNFLIITIPYLTFSILLFWAYTFKNIVLKVFVVLAMVSIFGIGYLSSTVGLLGLGFVITTLKADRAIQLSDNLMFRQYHLGDFIDGDNGIDICIYKSYKWMPMLQKKIFTRQYDLSLHGYDSAARETQNQLDTHKFKVKYNVLGHMLLISDNTCTKTIHLP